jgi:Rod binding domain-containing protein
VSSVDATGTDFQVGALPPGVQAPKTQKERALYQQALQFEGVFSQHLVDDMMQSAQGDDQDDSGGMGLYRQMINQTLNDALVKGGGLGLAGAVYASLKQQQGS